MQVGSLRVDPVPDGVIRYEPTFLVRPSFPGDPWDLHRDLLDASGRLELAVGGFLVRTGSRVILVDAGLGRLRDGDHEGGQLPASLAALGVSFDDVTDVVLTHLHFDHVGWATSRGSIVFPNATYRCHEADWTHFVTGPSRTDGAVKKLSPLADRLEFFSGGETLAPGVDVRLAAGHTPGSTAVVLSSGTARAMLLGDVVHCPVELTEGDWESLFDVDVALAKRTREALAREISAAGIPVAAAHFPGLRFGRLLAGAAAPTWTFD